MVDLDDIDVFAAHAETPRDPTDMAIDQMFFRLRELTHRWIALNRAQREAAEERAEKRILPVFYCRALGRRE